MNEKGLDVMEKILRCKHVTAISSEKALELIAEIRRLKDELESWQGLAHDRLKNWCMFFDRSSKLEKENMVYKVALEDIEQCNGIIDIYDAKKRAFVALEVDTNESK